MAPKKVPNGALRFVQEGCHAFAEDQGEGAEKKLQMTVYSGKIIKGHFYWGDLAIDLDGLEFNRDKYPVLEEHNRDKRIAFTGKPIIDEGELKLDPDKTTFLDNEHSLAFQKDSSKGFPFQASMFAKPSVIETINEGQKADVNGFSLKGPATIWRKTDFKEASVCVFGWDSQTVSSAFSKDIKTEVEFEEIGGDVLLDSLGNALELAKVTEKELKEVKEMPKTVEELQEKYPELAQQIADGVTDELTKKFKLEKDELESKNIQLTKTVDAQGTSIVALEKNDMLRSERELKAIADQMVANKLSASEVPERLFAKIRKLLDHNKFMKDDKLDKEAFAEAIDNEIKEFEDAGVTTSVLGFGTTGRTDEEDNPEKLAEKEDDEAVDELYELSGEVSDKEE